MKWVYCLAFCWFLEEDLWKVFWLPIWDRPLELVRVETRFLATIFWCFFLFLFCRLFSFNFFLLFFFLLNWIINNFDLAAILLKVHKYVDFPNGFLNLLELISSARVKSLVIRLCPHISWWIIEDTDIPKNSLTKLRKTYFELNGKLAI